MRATGTLDRDRIVAGALAVVLNVALFSLLVRQMQWHAPPPGADALEVVWIPVAPEMPPAALPLPPSADPREDARQAERRTRAASRTARGGTRPAPLPHAVAPGDARPLTAVLLMQVRRAAAEQAETFSPRPFANRPTTLPGRPADTFRMREPLTPARVVAGIGMLFGGSGYAVDACPELHRQVEQLGLTDSDADRRHALEQAQALCQ